MSCFWLSSFITLKYLENKKKGVEVKRMHDCELRVCTGWLQMDIWKGSVAATLVGTGGEFCS